MAGMAEFDFASRVTIGQYIPGSSIIHRLDPRARIVMTAILLAAAVFAPRLPGLALALVVLLIGLALARIPIGFALKGLLPPLPFLLLLVIINALFGLYEDAPPVLLTVGPLVLTLGDVIGSLILLLRFTVLILLLSLSTFTLSTSEMIHGVDSLLAPLSRLGLPLRDFSMMLQITLRFIPFMTQAAERIAKAQAARGAAWGEGRGGLLQRVRQVVPLIVPLFVSSLRRAENLAVAMDARGFSGGADRSSMISYHFRWRDAAAIALVALAAVAIVLL
jgi:energy-coupling factor transport system permease protein